MPSSIVRKAVVPVAGFGTSFLPETKTMPKAMLPIVDIPAIHFVIEEITKSGIEEILLISGQAKRAVEDHFDSSPELEDQLFQSGKTALLKEIRDISKVNFHYIRQKQQHGLGDAILCAKDFIDGEPFIVALPDDIILNDEETGLSQLLHQFETTPNRPSLAAARLGQGMSPNTASFQVKGMKLIPTSSASMTSRKNRLLKMPPAIRPSLGAISLRLTSLITWNSRQTALTDRSS